MAMPTPTIVPSQTALLVMHYQTDIMGLFPSVAPTLLSNTRALCDAARAKGVSVYGPTQVEAAINQDPTISAQRSLWGQQGSRGQQGQRGQSGSPESGQQGGEAGGPRDQQRQGSEPTGTTHGQGHGTTKRFPEA